MTTEFRDAVADMVVQEMARIEARDATPVAIELSEAAFKALGPQVVALWGVRIERKSDRDFPGTIIHVRSEVR